ncbi:MAG: helix-turn-helix domain-containing protein [Flavobacteriales bacterium]
MPTLIVQPPTGPLVDSVEAITFHEGHHFEHEREIFLPDGGIDLVIDLGARAKKLYHSEQGRDHTTFSKGWISGMRSSRYIIECGDGSAMIVVRFKPGKARRFTGLPMCELNDRVVPLVDLWGGAFNAVRDRIGEHWERHGADGIIAAVCDALMRIARPDHHEVWRVGLALEAMNGTDGSQRVAAISKKLGCSGKHLIDLFHREVGLGPKAYSNVVRFQAVVRRLESEPDPDWLDVAVQHGYYDHSHLANSFNLTAGMSPERYLKAKGPFLNWIPVVELR